jgi:hypothetical protein
MPATLLTPVPLNTIYNEIFDEIQRCWEIARKARLLQTTPTVADAYTLYQTPPATMEANILAVEDVLRRISALQVKLDDANSELTFAINFLKDWARRSAALPTAIAGHPFGVLTT